ncbi:S66 family peptidase [Agathobacter sp.]
MRYPQFLKENGKIGFVAPSMGCTTEPYKSAFDNAIKKFNAMGYKTVEGPNCRCDNGIGISNTPQKCGQELNESYTSADSDVLISCGGGELMCEVVPYIDFDMIKRAQPKWYMGYSDNTNFTFLSATIADTASIYGPCAGTFGMEHWHESLHDAFDLLCGKKTAFTGYPKWEIDSIKDENAPFVGYNLTEESCISSIPSVSEKSEPITLSGRLIGGCMDCLVNLCGTSFDKVTEFADRYQDDGIIWFLEACDLNVMSMRRAMWQMKNAGWFSHVKGFLIGRPAHFGEEMFGIDHREALSSLIKEYNVPIIMDLDIGHLSPMMPVVCGSMADVRFDGSKFSIEYKML